MEELIRVTERSNTEDELLKKLLDNIESPFFMLQSHQATSNPSPSIHSQFLSAVYPGPSVEDIETALSYANYGIHNFHHEAESDTNRSSFMQEVGYLNTASCENNKYTLRIKSCSNVMADDGYKWRKYGQKSIKNSPNPRSYYRCTNPRCSAKKQVERSIDDPDTLIITYEGLHLHFAYPFFSPNDPHPVDPPKKKYKRPISEAQFQAHDVESHPLNGPEHGPLSIEYNPTVDPSKEFEQEIMGGQGLLEDMVPLMIRKPLMNNTSSNSSSCASHESHDPSSPASSNSCYWSPDYSFLGLM